MVLHAAEHIHPMNKYHLSPSELRAQYTAADRAALKLNEANLRIALHEGDEMGAHDSRYEAAIFRRRLARRAKR